MKYLLLFWAALATFSLQAESGFYVFFKKPDKWNQVFMYTWYEQDAKLVEPHGRWPGKALVDVAGWYRGTIETSPAAGTNLIFNNAQGEQTPDLNRQGNGWYVQRWYDLNPELQQYAVNVQDGSGSGTYSPGTLVQIKATPPEPFLFRGWLGGSGLIADVGRLDNQFSMPSRDVQLVADYEDLRPGQTQFQALCARCHGAQGQGGVGPSLLIKQGQCTSCAQDALLEARIRETMPLGKVGQCTGSCAHDITRYIRYSLNTQTSLDCGLTVNKAGRRQLRLLTLREYRQSVRAILGVTSISALNDWPEPAHVLGYSNNADAAVVSDRHLLVFTKAAHQIASQARFDSPSCQGDKLCLIHALGLQLYRRPLTATELAGFANQTLPSVLEVMLQSPYFLYRSELGTFLAPMNLYALDPYEVATALAYTLTGSPPDDILLAAAADGSLKTADRRRTEAERLLKTPAARDTISDFVLQWLGIEGLPFVTRDNGRLAPAVRADMLEETKRFLGDLIFEQNAAVKDFYLAATTPLSRSLATYYSLPVPSTDWQSVAYDGERRGLIAQGAILATYANSKEASPIKRGVFVRNRLLCQDLPPPPANVDTTIPPPSPGLTMRERLARHQSQGQQSDGSNSCASCHQYIDGLGFGFERFDEVGLWRRSYLEKPDQIIDSSGALKSPLSLADKQTLAFADFPALSVLLAENARAKACVGIQYLRYARGRSEQGSDQCIDTEIQSRLQQDQSVRSMLVDFVSSDSFIWRK